MKSKSLLVLVAAIVTSASGCGGGYASSPPTNPVPSIDHFNPTAAVAGGPGFTLGIVGATNFVAGCSDLSTPCAQGSIVRWNGSDRPTIVFPYVYSCSASQCTGYADAGTEATAQIAASAIAEPGTAEISVFSPAPGGGTSNTVTFTIAAHGVFPSSVAVHPAGTFAYVTNSGSDNVSTYAINTDGTLTFKATLAAGRNPVSIAVHSSGKFAYVANIGDGSVLSSVSMYTIDTTTGALTPNGELSGAGSRTTVVVDPSGRFAYVANGDFSNILMYTIDATTGALTYTSTIPAGTVPVSVAVDPSGKFAYVANFGADTDFGHDPGSVSMYTIDTTTGALMPNGEITNDGSKAVVVDPSGRFAYVGNSGGVSMYSIDTTTGKLTSIGTEAQGVLSLVVHPSGKFAYATVGLPGCRFNCPPTAAASYVLAYTLNATTGVLASNGTAPTEQSPTSIAIAPSGKFAYVANYDSHSISMYAIDAVTGTLTLIGTIGT